MKISRTPEKMNRIYKIILIFITLVFSQSVYAQNNPQLESELMMTLRLSAGEQINAGDTLIGPITGGSFSGDGFQGTVLPGGADWMSVSEGHNNLNVRITLQTDSGEYIYMSYTGILIFAENPADMYWTVAINFQTASEQLDWINRIVAVGKGRIENGLITYDIFRII